MTIPTFHTGGRARWEYYRLWRMNVLFLCWGIYLQWYTKKITSP